MKEYILAHDLGTSGNKATLYRMDGTLAAAQLIEYPTYYPGERRVEQKPSDWWDAVIRSTRLMMEKAGIDGTEIAAISFSGQMMGCLIVDGKGEPVRDSIIWADTHAAPQEKAMIERVGLERGYEITGHRLSASYGAAKLMWIRDEEPELYKKAYKVLNAKDYIIYKLTGEFVTDYSDAGGMELFDLNGRKWSQELCDAFEIDVNLLPEVMASTAVAGYVTEEAARECGIAAGIPVVIGGGDGSCATVGAGAVREGETYCVLGSSAWISTVRREAVYDPSMRTFNWVHLDPNFVDPCGSMQAAGYSLAWFRNNLCGEEKIQAREAGVSAYKLIDYLVEASKPGANGVLYLPYILGERSPRWNHEATGSFTGIRVTTEKKDLARAVLEGVGYNLRVILEAFDKPERVKEVAFIGGGAKSRVWAKILADIWQRPLTVPRYLEEATSMGAAVCAGVGVGAYPDFTVVDRFNPVDERILPNPENAEVYDKMYRVFNDLYDRLCPVYHELSGI